MVKGERASENMHGPPNSSPQWTRLSCVSPSKMRSEGRREISKLARLRISRVRPSRRWRSSSDGADKMSNEPSHLYSAPYHIEARSTAVSFLSWDMKVWRRSAGSMTPCIKHTQVLFAGEVSNINTLGSAM